jgi:hypothetical protein
MKITDLPLDQNVFALFVSRSGDGKSSAAASFPAPKFYDFDRRIRGIQWTSEIVPEYKAIDYEYFSPDKGFKDVEKSLEALVASVKTRTCPFKTIVWDSLTNGNRLFLTDSFDFLKPTDKGVKMMGSLRVPAMGEFLYESTACSQIFDYLRTLPLNVIVTAHVIERYGKAPGADAYSENVVVGEKLSVRDKIGENVLTYFDEVYQFDREVFGNEVKHYVSFRSTIAKTAYKNLPNGKQDITGKNFYEYWKEKIA